MIIVIIVSKSNKNNNNNNNNNNIVIIEIRIEILGMGSLHIKVIVSTLKEGTYNRSTICDCILIVRSTLGLT